MWLDRLQGLPSWGISDWRSFWIFPPYPKKELGAICGGAPDSHRSRPVVELQHKCYLCHFSQVVTSYCPESHQCCRCSGADHMLVALGKGGALRAQQVRAAPVTPAVRNHPPWPNRGLLTSSAVRTDKEWTGSNNSRRKSNSVLTSNSPFLGGGWQPSI